VWIPLTTCAPPQPLNSGYATAEQSYTQNHDSLHHQNILQVSDMNTAHRPAITLTSIKYKYKTRNRVATRQSPSTSPAFPGGSTWTPQHYRYKYQYIISDMSPVQQLDSSANQPHVCLMHFIRRVLEVTHGSTSQARKHFPGLFPFP